MYTYTHTYIQVYSYTTVLDSYFFKHNILYFTLYNCHSSLARCSYILLSSKVTIVTSDYITYSITFIKANMLIAILCYLSVFFESSI